MKIQVFEVIKQGIDLSFKDKKILTLIALFSILGIIYAILIKPKDFIDAAIYPLVSFVLLTISFIFLYAIAKATFKNLNKQKTFIYSYKKSCNIAKGNWWQILALWFVIFIIFATLIFFLFTILTLILPLYLSNIILMTVLYFITGVMIVVFTIVYFQLIGKRKKNEKRC